MNYIVSGLPRSGTSMMMQILAAGKFPIATDRKREVDINNPRGYFEIDSIINKIQDNPSFIYQFNGKVVKIVAYGLKFLPIGKYKIIFMVRNIDEIMDSMEKMSGKVDRENEKKAFMKLSDVSIRLMEKREDIQHLIVHYSEVVQNPKREIERIDRFLDGQLDVDSAVKAVDPRLYRNVRK
jgi:hypothetical protein